MPTIYASLPLSGPAGGAGREVLRGAEEAPEQLGHESVKLLALDTGGDDRETRAEDAASRAAADESAVAYLGDFYSSQVAATSPILGSAGLLQVPPVATWAELRGPTLVLLMPNDAVGARAIAYWLIQAGVSELLLVHDHDPDYGVEVGLMCTEAARERRIVVRSRPIWNHDEEWAGDIGNAQAVLYVGVAGSEAVQLWQDLHTAKPELWLLGTEGVAVPWLAAAMSPSAAERTRFFLAQREPFGFYGHEAMALILDALAEGGDDREGIVTAAQARHMPTTAYGCLAVVDGELVSA
jgi:ABC-type branched-subunit amino acid transport system substrate-binding protein